jgi:hypothetical protein
VNRNLRTESDEKTAKAQRLQGRGEGNGGVERHATANTKQNLQNHKNRHAPGTSSLSKSANCSTSGACNATVKGEGAWTGGISHAALPSSEKEEKNATLMISLGLRLACSNLRTPRGG